MRPLHTFPLPQILINALNNCGFACYEDLFDNENEIHETANKILKDYFYSSSALRELTKLPNIISATHKLRDEDLKESIPTFCEALDDTLGGGLPLNSMLHVCGPPGSGKTLLVLQLCVAVQIPVCLGGLDGAAVFIDTNHGFSTSRLRGIAEGAFNYCRNVAKYHNLTNEISTFSVDAMLDNVYYMPVGDYVQLIASVHMLKKFILKNSKVKLIVIDCLTFPFLTLLNTLERTRIIYTILSQLNHLAQLHNLAVVVTNHLTTKMMKNGKQLAPALGESFVHRIPETLLLATTTNGKNAFSAVLTKSPRLPQTMAHFSIVKGGLRDIS